MKILLLYRLNANSLGSDHNANKRRKQDKVPILKIKIGNQKQGSSDENAELSERESEEKSKDANDAFKKPFVKKKAKTNTGMKNEKKKKIKTINRNAEGDGGEHKHQDYCKVCQQGGKTILCDICSKAYHLVCLEPELTGTPEGKRSCPTCEAYDPIEQEDKVVCRK